MAAVEAGAMELELVSLMLAEAAAESVAAALPSPRTARDSGAACLDAAFLARIGDVAVVAVEAVAVAV